MNKEEYVKWCDWVFTESKLNPPKAFAKFTSNYWSWSARAFIARCLKREGKLEPAFRLMETVVEARPEEDSHYAWALSDLGYLYWTIYKDKDNAIHYLRESLNVLDSTEENYNELEFFSSGGKYLRTLLEILYVSGDVEEAKNLGISEIKRYKEKYSNEKLNSYLFEVNLLLAYIEKKEGNYETAIEYMKKGLSASEYADECTVLCSQNHDSLEQLYNKLLNLSRSMIVYFEV